MNKKIKAAFYTFLVLLVFGLMVIGGRIYPYETKLIIVFLCLCVIVFFVYLAILSIID